MGEDVGDLGEGVAHVSAHGSYCIWGAGVSGGRGVPGARGNHFGFVVGVALTMTASELGGVVGKCAALQLSPNATWGELPKVDTYTVCGPPKIRIRTDMFL